MSEAVITYRGTVYPWHCDHMSHMNVMWYVSKFDEATWQFFNHLMSELGGRVVIAGEGIVALAFAHDGGRNALTFQQRRDTASPRGITTLRRGRGLDLLGHGGDDSTGHACQKQMTS